MTEKIYLVVAVLGLLETKHLIADFFLQSVYQLKNKGTYGHPGGLLHSGIHAAGSCVAFLVITPSLAVGIGLIAAEFVLHYHIDWVREQIGYRWKLHPDESGYWRLLGIDQWLHHMTYVGFVAVLAAATP